MAIFRGMNFIEADEHGCHDCANNMKEGGDYVPYGSTFVPLPVFFYCESPDVDWNSLTDDEQAEFQEKNGGPNCKYWRPKKK